MCFLFQYIGMVPGTISCPSAVVVYLVPSQTAAYDTGKPLNRYDLLGNYTVVGS